MSDSPILICYDGSREAARAIEVTGRALGNRRAIVLDVAPVLTPAESIGALAPVTGGASYAEVNEDDAAVRASDGAALARAAGLDATGRGTVAAPAWEGVLDVADDVDAALIVIGSRGLRGARELVEGSLSHQLVQHSGRPLLIVPPPQRRD